METNLERVLTSLGRGSLLRIEAGAGKTVAVFRGQVWITQSDDPRDVFLGDGESFTLDRPGLAIVQSLQDSRVLVFDRFASREDTNRAGMSKVSPETSVRTAAMRAQPAAATMPAS